MGIGGTVLTPTSLAIVANLYPEPRERARAIGLWGVSAGIGTGLGPIVGGAITDAAGWRAVFAGERHRRRHRRADRDPCRAALAQPRPAPARRARAGAAVTFLATLTYALIEAPNVGWGSARTVGLFAASARWRSRSSPSSAGRAHPLVDLHTFDDRQFSGSVVITVAIFFVFAAFIYENAIYLQNVRGYSALEAGLLTLPRRAAVADRRPARRAPGRHPRAARGALRRRRRDGARHGAARLAARRRGPRHARRLRARAGHRVRRRQRADQRDRRGRHAAGASRRSPPRSPRAHATSASSSASRSSAPP